MGTTPYGQILLPDPGSCYFMLIKYSISYSVFLPSLIQCKDNYSTNYKDYTHYITDLEGSAQPQE